jgi:hypothetical protein
MILTRTPLPVLFVLATTPLHGQATSWRFGVEMDNDFFVTFDPYAATDHEYTHGTRIWMESGAFGLLPRLLPRIIECGDAAHCRHRLSIGQEIYTPRRETAGVVYGERPHAGWLYTSIETRRIDPRAATTFRVQIGVVGPPAFGEEVQTTVHRWFSFRVPQGWEHQLPFEPTVQLHLLRRAHVLEVPAGPVRLTAGYGVGADLGNALTQGEAGIQGQACLGGMLCTSVDDPPARSGIVLRGFVGGRGVLRNVFLDGTLRDSHSVSREPWVSIAAASLAVHVRRVMVEYELMWRQREYRSEPTDFTYGALRLQVAW